MFTPAPVSATVRRWLSGGAESQTSIMSRFQMHCAAERSGGMGAPAQRGAPAAGRARPAPIAQSETTRTMFVRLVCMGSDPSANVRPRRVVTDQPIDPIVQLHARLQHRIVSAAGSVG